MVASEARSGYRLCMLSVFCVHLREGIVMFFFFKAEDGIRDLVRSRGLGDVYKRQPHPPGFGVTSSDLPPMIWVRTPGTLADTIDSAAGPPSGLSLIHI